MAAWCRTLARRGAHCRIGLVVASLLVLSSVPVLVAPPPVSAGSPGGFIIIDPHFFYMNDLNGVSCPTTSICVAVGNDGHIFVTTDAGQHWTPVTSGTINNLNGVACPTADTCYAVANVPGDGTILHPGSGLVLKITAGGGSWSSTTLAIAPAPAPLFGIACPAVDTCYAVGGTTLSAAILKITGGGSSASPTTMPFVPLLRGVACPAVDTCYAVGDDGNILGTTDGVNWSSQSSGTSAKLHSVSCTSLTVCYAVGDGGVILKSMLVGGSVFPHLVLPHEVWTSQTSGTTAALHGISCPATDTCFAAGGGGVLVTTSNGQDWSNLTSGTSYELNGIACPSDTLCYIVGAHDTVIKLDTAPPTPPGTPAATPEASSSILLGAGIVVLVILLRRRRQHN